MAFFTKLHDLITRRSALRVLRHRAYAIYLVTDFMSNVGQWAFRVGTGWLAWELTHSGAWIGALAFMELFPSTVFGPIGGALVDRRDRLAMVKLTQGLSMLTSAAMTMAGRGRERNASAGASASPG